MASKKNFFEDKIKEATPKVTYILRLLVNFAQDPSKGEIKPVGQREWTPTRNGHTGAHNTNGYGKQVGGGFRESMCSFITRAELIDIDIISCLDPPPKKNLNDLP